MKTLFSILCFALMLSAASVKEDSLYIFSDNQAFLLKEGFGNITANDSGVSAVITEGTAWIRGEKETFFLTLPVGTAAINGVAWIQTDDTAATIKVVKGYIRFTSVGGFPGETITAGYTRRVTKAAALSRTFNALTQWKQFCEESPEEGAYFGCPQPEPEKEPMPEPVDLSNSVIVLIHKAIAKQELAATIEKLSPHTNLARVLKDPKQRIVPLVDISTDLLFTLELSRQEQPYIIADLRIEEHPNKANTLFITVDLYDGVEKRSSTREFTTEIQSKLSTETYQDEILLPEEFYQLVKMFIFEKISSKPY